MTTMHYVVMAVPSNGYHNPHYPVAVLDTPEQAGAFITKELFRMVREYGDPSARPLYVYPVERVTTETP